MSKLKKILSRSGLTVATAVVIIGGAAAFSAFEAHIINVTATIENALSVDTAAIDYGTVFPQEHLEKPLQVSLSGSFLSEPRVDDVSYFIRQKPKCGITSANGTVLVGGSTTTGHITIGDNPATLDVVETSFTDCGPTPALDGDQVFGVLPSLCPYLSKEADNVPAGSTGDTSLSSFHVPFQIVQGDNPATTDVTETSYVSYTDALGHLSKAQGDTIDNWIIDLAVPTFNGQSAQDWADFVHSFNTQANPADFVLNPLDEHKVFGCDLWVEVSGVSTSVNPNTVVGPNDLETVLANAATSHKWYFYDDTNDVLNNSLGSFVAGPATPPTGTGSAQVTLADNSSRVFLANSGYGGTALSSLTQLKFSDYSNSSVGGPNEAPFVRFNVDFSGAAGYQNSLVYVPSVNGAIVKDTWQTWDLINGGTANWIYSGANWPVATAGPDFGGPVTPGTTLRTWTQILADYPAIQMHPLFPQIGVRFGEPGPAGYVGNTDAFTIATGGPATVYDFEQ